MQTPKISIIVPVYNAEDTIRKCLNSIASQSFLNWEAVLVDDGSPDNSGIICDEYATKDTRFRVIHKQNGGVSSARQAGLEHALGEYVIHVDPDDWIESEMLQALYAKAKEENADMVICDFYNDINGKSHYLNQAPSSMNSHTILKEMFENIHGSTCNKLIKRECIQKYGTKFPKDINYCEDVCFNTQLLTNNIKVIYLNKAFYHYVQYRSSITNDYTWSTFENQKKFVDYLCSILPANSSPVLKSKLLVKKLVFKNNILSKKEFSNLYPDIKKTNDNNYILRLMYDSAFNGQFWIAYPLLFVYRILKSKNTLLI